MSKTLKKPNPPHKPVLALSALLFAFTSGLLVAWLVPGAVLAFLIGFFLTTLALLAGGLYLLLTHRIDEFNRHNRPKRSKKKAEKAVQ
jgi:hypothetical protein